MGEQRARECHARKSFTVQATKGERGVCDRHRQEIEQLGRVLHLKVRVIIAPQSPSYYCKYLSRWGSCIQICCEILDGSAELLVLLRVLGPVRVRLQVIPVQLALSAIVETATALKRLGIGVLTEIEHIN